MPVKSNFILFIFIFNFIFSHSILPENDSSLNYTQIQFNWPQFETDSNTFFINITDLSTDLEYQIQTSTQTVVIDTFLTWNKSYSWEVCNTSNYCLGSFNFNINPLPDNYPNNTNIYTDDTQQYTPGVNLIDLESLNFSIVINEEVEPIWFADQYNFAYNRFSSTQILPNGNIVGLSLGVGYEVDLNSNIVFETPNGYSVHHDFNKTPNDTYMAVTAVTQNNYCPEECFNPDWDLIPWQGDVFIEFDENGDVIWEWSSFDHIDSTEYNPYYVQTYNGFSPMDWTHANAVFYDELTHSVFVSIRNLSRIIKIDYDTHEIDWELGEHDYMDSIYFDQEFGFSQQHSSKIIDNGNLLFFDNHRYQDPELSRCMEFELFPENDSIALVWEYILPDSLFTGSRGECDRLPNGHTLITAGRTGQVIEINENDEIVWHFSSRMNNINTSIYRSERIPNLYPLIFDVHFNNFAGNENSIIVNRTPSNEILFEVTNLGWLDDTFFVQFTDNQNNVIETEEFISADSSFVFNFQLNSNTNEDVESIVSVYPTLAPELIKTYNIITLAHLIGDVNMDSLVNVQDIILLVNNIINEEEYFELGDLNNDTIINVMDIIAIVNIIIQ